MGEELKKRREVGNPSHYWWATLSPLSGKDIKDLMTKTGWSRGLIRAVAQYLGAVWRMALCPS